ncbi:hypothetical protein FACS1894139_03310 [Planctomycetales bacterium]|nr:hypothetical protein FACS1894139_03310 [Planctomycetales bacterium]
MANHVTLATALGGGGISILSLTGLPPNAPEILRTLTAGELRHHWLRDRAGVIVDEVLIGKTGESEEFLLTGHGGSAAALALLQTLRAAGYEEKTDGNFFGAWGELLAQCRTPAQVNAVAAACAADDSAATPRLRDFLRVRRVVIAGATNSGKSSLFNELAGGDFALVSAEARATRDPLRHETVFGGFSCELFDTAGWDGAAASAVDAEAFARGQNELRAADLVLFVAAADRAADARAAQIIGENLPPTAPLIIAQNKSDLAPPPLTFFPSAPRVAISCRAATGIEELRETIEEQLRIMQVNKIHGAAVNRPTL